MADRVPESRWPAHYDLRVIVVKMWTLLDVDVVNQLVLVMMLWGVGSAQGLFVTL